MVGFINRCKLCFGKDGTFRSRECCFGPANIKAHFPGPLKMFAQGWLKGEQKLSKILCLKSY